MFQCERTESSPARRPPQWCNSAGTARDGIHGVGRIPQAVDRSRCYAGLVVPIPVIALVGFMGSGTSTVGRRLAGELGVPFADLDARIEEESGLPVREWFARRGEPAFRAAERAALARACDDLAATGGVIALGGGAFTVPAVRAFLAGRARTVWLDAPLAAIEGRVPDDGTRPLFGDPASTARLFAERRAAYALADLRIDAGGPVDEVVGRIRTALAHG